MVPFCDNSPGFPVGNIRLGRRFTTAEKAFHRSFIDGCAKLPMPKACEEFANHRRYIHGGTCEVCGKTWVSIFGEIEL